MLCCGAQLSQAEFLRAFGVSELKKDQAVLVRTAEKKAELLKIFKAKDGDQAACVLTINEAKGCEFEVLNEFCDVRILM